MAIEKSGTITSTVAVTPDSKVLPIPERVKLLASKVKEYTAKEERGCPGGWLLYVGGFSAKEIEAAINLKVLEATRGKEGGYYLFGEKPEPQDISPSLKARMAGVLESLLKGDKLNRVDIQLILSEYNAEMNMRKEVIAHAREVRAEKSSSELSPDLK